jgi:hypothetical protein
MTFYEESYEKVKNEIKNKLTEIEDCQIPEDILDFFNNYKYKNNYIQERE